jgi:hypothetical protein
MKISDQLRAEWALINKPEKWTKGEYARDKAGNFAILESKSACKFCQEGARITVLGIEAYSTRCDNLIVNDADDLAHNVAKLFGFSNAIFLNDHSDTTHDDMRIFYDTMIYIAEQCE